MKKFSFNKLLAIFIVTFMSSLSQAHHSFSMYDRTEVYLVTGVVTSLNPDLHHLQVFFAVMNDERDGVFRDDNNKPILWAVEMASTSSVARFGITSSNIIPGTIFSIAFHPERGGKRGGVQAKSEQNNVVMYRCPEKTPPEPGKHCDSVEGSTALGSNGGIAALPQPTGRLPALNN